MKKLSLKSKILLGAILLGGTVAGAHELSTIPSADDPTYNWKGASNAPDNPGQNLNGKTVQQARDHFGCDGDANLCATGTPTAGGSIVTINFD